MARQRNVVPGPQGGQPSAFAQAGKEMQDLAAQTQRVHTAFAQIVADIPVIGTTARLFGDVLTTARQLGTIVEGIPKLLSGDFGSGAVNAGITAPRQPLAPGQPGGGLQSVELAGPTPLPVTFVGTGASPFAGPTLVPPNEMNGPNALQDNTVKQVELVHPIPLRVEVENWPGDTLGTEPRSVAPREPIPTLTPAEMEGESGTAAASGGSGLTAVAGPVALLGAAALVAGGELKQMGEKAFSFVALARPAEMNLFNRAVLDAEATIGAKFVPVVTVATDLMRSVGSFAAEALPNSQEVSQFMKEFAPEIQQVKDTMHDLAPVVHELAVVGMRTFAQEVKLAGQALKVLAPIPAFILAQLPKNPNAAPNVMGAAVNTPTVGGLEDVSRRIFELALAQGGPEQELPPTFDQLKAANEWLDKIYTAITGYTGTKEGNAADKEAAGDIFGLLVGDYGFFFR